MIILDNVSKYYPTKFGRNYVLRDVSITLPQDRNIGILGINGGVNPPFYAFWVEWICPIKAKSPVIAVSRRLHSMEVSGSMTGRRILDLFAVSTECRNTGC